MRKIISGLAATLALGMLVTGADAHARLIRSDPRAGTTVHAPGALKLWFSETIIGDKSSVKLLGRSGLIDVGKVVVARDNARAVTVQLPHRLGPGSYKLNWTMATADTHTMDGSFSFKVR